LTTRSYVADDHKKRGKAAGARRTLGFFVKEKFDAPGVKVALEKYCAGRPCKKVIVIWEWGAGVKEAAAEHGIELWDFRELMRDIATLGKDKRTYFGDDTLRTLTLFARAIDGTKSI
jgi:hypothetical protein